MAMLEQTKRTIRKMKEAGFERSEFSVNVDRHYIPNSRRDYGKALYEYGDAVITVTSSSAYKNIGEMVDQIIVAGLGVTEYCMSNGKSSWHLTTKHNKHKVVELNSWPSKGRMK